MPIIREEDELEQQAESAGRGFPEEPEFSRAERHAVVCCEGGGSEEQLRRMFEAVEKANVPATFFIGGQTAEHFPALVREIAARHQVESNTYSRPDLCRMSFRQQREELSRGRDVLQQLIERPVRGFRAPGGRANRNTARALHEERFVFDASFRWRHSALRDVEALANLWQREWSPLAWKLGVAPGFSLWWRRIFMPHKRLNVFPVRAQLTGRSPATAAAFVRLLLLARAAGVTFWYADDYLHTMRGVPQPAHRPPGFHPPPRIARTTY